MRSAEQHVLDQPIAWLVARPWMWCILVVAVLVVYALSYSPHWWIGEDSALYLNLARNLARGDGYTIAHQPHTTVPPGLPGILGVLMRAGVQEVWALNLLMLAVSLCVICMTYLLLRTLVHSHWAAILTVSLAFTKHMVELSGQLLTEFPAMLLTLTALVILSKGLSDNSWRRWWPVGALLLTASVWFRLASIPLVIGAGAGLLLSGWRTNRRHAVMTVGVMAGCLLATVIFFYIYYRNNHPPSAASYAWRVEALVHGRMNHIASLLFASHQFSRLVIAQRMPAIVSLLLLVVPVLLAAIRRLRRGDWLIVMATLCYVGGIIVLSEKPRTRYLVLVAPMLLLLLIEGYCRIATLLAERWRNRHKYQPNTIGAGMASILVMLIVAMNLPPVGAHLLEKRMPNYAVEQQRGKRKYVYEVAGFLKNQPDDRMIFASQPIAYLADRQAMMPSNSLLESRPDDEQLAQLLENWNIGYVVLDADLMEESPMMLSMQNYLRQSGKLVFQHEDATVFALP